MINYFTKLYFDNRQKDISHWLNNPIMYQNKTFDYLINNGKKTIFGNKHNFKNIKNYSHFKDQVPTRTYEDLYTYINDSLKGNPDILWPGRPIHFAKSSGTTDSKSKFIPITKENLYLNHYKCGKDMISFMYKNDPKTQFHKGKSLLIGGSREINKDFPKSYIGDLSSALIGNLPVFYRFKKVPSIKTCLLKKWTEKLEKITEETKNENVTYITGVPSWGLKILEKICEENKINNILEIWKNFEWVLHGGVKFEPYQERFNKLLPSQNVKYLEIYNASEGYIALQNDIKDKGLLLMVNHGIFYEFKDIKTNQIFKIEDIKINNTYSLIISTNSGLWRYEIGDVVKIVSIKPYKILIVGRTKLFINMFGEELIIDNVEKGIKNTCEKTGASIIEFTAAPVLFENNKSGFHHWLIEFDKNPNSLDNFANILDDEIRNLNSDYDAKRENNILLSNLKITPLEKNTFYKWQEKNNKVGGQNKVPRLSNNNKIIEEILKITKI